MGRDCQIASKVFRYECRSDNSVKNHYHSRLRKALRKINKCINDHLAVISRPLKASLLSRIVQTAEAYYIPSEKVDALLAFSNYVLN